jgi:hypothetical protein
MFFAFTTSCAANEGLDGDSPSDFVSLLLKLDYM